MYRQIRPVALLRAAVGLHANIVNRVVRQTVDIVKCIRRINGDGVIVPSPIRSLVLQDRGCTRIGILPGDRHVGCRYRTAGQVARGVAGGEFKQVIAVCVRPGARRTGGARLSHIVEYGLVGVVQEDNIGSIAAHTRLSGHIRQNGRRGGGIHDLDVVAALEELHLPAQQRGSGGGDIGGCRKLNHAHAVGCGADHLVVHITAVCQVTVTAQHVDLRGVYAGIRAAERGRIVTRPRHGGSESQISVRVDGKLRVVGASEIEGEPDVLHI